MKNNLKKFSKIVENNRKKVLPKEERKKKEEEEKKRKKEKILSNIYDYYLYPIYFYNLNNNKMYGKNTQLN